MQALVRFFVDRHLLVNVFALAMVVLGLVALSKLQREFLPSFDAPILWVSATLPGASARDVETKLTIPIEEALAEVEGIQEYHTLISDSVSFTTVELYEDYSADEIKLGEKDVRNAIDAISDFPPEMDDEPVIELLNSSNDVVVEVALTGPADELADAAELLEARLERLDTVSQVRIIGLPDREVRILIDPARAIAHDITLTDIISAIEKRNVSSTGGNLESNSDQRQIVMWSRYQQPEDVASTILKFDEAGGLLRIEDVARIESGREDARLLVRNDGQRGLVLLVHRRAASDIVDVVQDVRDTIAATPLSAGIRTKLGREESFIITNRLSMLANNGLMGLVLVTVVLLYFVRLQPAIWIMVGIPVVFFAAFTVFQQFGLTMNMMAMNGFIIVLGMVVDDAVVVSERIAYLQARGIEARRAAVEGTMEMMPAVTAAALTTMLAFAPLIAVGGMPGKISWQIPAVVVIVLIASVIETFFILPAHMSTVGAGAELGKRRILQRLEQEYEKLLHVLLHHRVMVIASALLVLVVVMGFIRPAVPFVLFPQDDADRMYVKISAPLGTPLRQTEASVVEIERQLQSILDVDVQAILSRVGHQNNASSDKQVGEASNEALIIVQFRRGDRQHSNAEWIPILKSKMQLPPELQVIYQSAYFGPPSDQPVTLHILANDDETRRSVAHEAAQYLKSVPGVIEIEVNERPGTPQIDLRLDYEKLALLGLDAQTVGLTLTAAFHGIEASEHRDVDDTTKLRVMFEPAARADLNAVLDVPIRAADGSLRRIRDVVQPVESPALTRIYHRDGFRAATVRASFTPESGLTALPFAAQLEEEFISRFKHMPELMIFNGGEAADTKSTAGNLQTAAMLAVGGITVVVWIMLGSLIEALFILVVIPFALASVFLTFFLHGKPMSMFAMAGTIGLFGVVVNGAIVMVDSIHRRLNAAGPVSNGEAREILVGAVVLRLRPILVTTLTTLGGVLPTAYGIGGYDPIISTMSLAIGWGLFFSTFVTLFVVPVLYSLAKDLSSRFGW